MGKGDQDPSNLMISDTWWKGQGLLATWYVMKQRNGATRFERKVGRAVIVKSNFLSRSPR